MAAILMRASYPTSQSNDTQFKLIQDESEKNECMLQYRSRSKAFAKQQKMPQVIKLDFIYPDDYTETILMKAR